MSAAEQLEALVARASRRGLHDLDRSELRALPSLYRLTVAELAEARSRGLARASLFPLEALVLRAHGLLYAPPPLSLGRGVGELLVEYPARVRRAGLRVAFAALLLAVGGIFGALEVHADPGAALILMPGSMQENAESFREERSPPRAGEATYGAFYFTNNAQVAATAFALGTTFGVGTLLVLLYNGLLLGATIALVAARGSLWALLSYVLPHGGVELTAIAIAAAGGFGLARAVIAPGFRRRRDALVSAAREALPLALGSAVLLAVAGLVEGWISPKPWPLRWKAAIGLSLDLALALYLCLPAPKALPPGLASPEHLE